MGLFDLTARKPTTAEPQQAAHLAELVEELTTHGRVRMFQYDSGEWSATCSLFLPKDAGEFEIKAGGGSENCETFYDAVLACLNKVKATKAALGVKL